MCKKIREHLSLPILVGFVLVIWVAAPLGVELVVGSDRAEAGQFGDLYGSVNALFSGLAFAVLIYTITLQRKDLALQQQQLKAQLDEMVESRQELKKQAKAQHALAIATVGQIRAMRIRVEIDEVLRFAERNFRYRNSNHHKKDMSNFVNELNQLVDDLAASINDSEAS